MGSLCCPWERGAGPAGPGHSLGSLSAPHLPLGQRGLWWCLWPGQSLTQSLKQPVHSSGGTSKRSCRGRPPAHPPEKWAIFGFHERPPSPMVITCVILKGVRAVNGRHLGQRAVLTSAGVCRDDPPLPPEASDPRATT